MLLEIRRMLKKLVQVKKTNHCHGKFSLIL